jgi:DNA-binding NarL/FixJ family response regulator
VPLETGSGEGIGPAPQGRILIVEDDYLVALSNEMALTEAGFDVIGVVDSGEAALMEVAKTAPDLVLMDIRLAGDMDGIETALALRAQGVRSLFASANSDPGTVTRGETAQPLGWLRKPFSDHVLIAAIEAALAKLQSE